MFYAETLGLPVVLAALQRHAERHGAAHWQPAPLLVELVERGCSLADWQREQMHEHA